MRDGHESHASFRRHGAGSLTRTIHTAAGVQLGQARWAIENAGFNTLVNDGHADHVYRHEPPALLVCTLLGRAVPERVALLCLNVLLAFYRRDLKPAPRHAASRLHVARRITAALYGAGFATAARVVP